MKISAINQNINFQGLWTRTKRNSRINGKTGLNEICEIRVYRPFSDEKKREVQEFVNGMNYSHDDYCSRTKCVTKIGEKLPFTEAEFWAYQDAKSTQELSDEQLDIHYLVRDLYLTSEANNQETAENLDIDF